MKQYQLITFNLIIILGCEVTTEKKENINQISKVQNLEINFQLPDLDGNIHHSSEWQGKAKLINFWATWCAPCRREIPDFNKLHDKYQKDGLEIVGITITSGSPERIYNFMKEWDIEYTVLTDIEDYETQRVTAYYGRAIGQPITGLPTTLIIDRGGYIVKGYIDPRNEEIFYQDLKPYLSF